MNYKSCWKMFDSHKRGPQRGKRKRQHTCFFWTYCTAVKVCSECSNTHKCIIHFSLIGASLSESHTSMTALCTCVCTKCMLACLLRLTTYQKVRMSIFKYFKKLRFHVEIQFCLVRGCEWLLPDCSVTVKKTTSEDS